MGQNCTTGIILNTNIKLKVFMAAYERKLDKYHCVFTLLLDFFS